MTTERRDVSFAIVPAGTGGGINRSAVVFAEVGVILNFKMRGLKDPGPGYEAWVVQATPDFLGTSAPGPVQAGTVVVAAIW